MKSPLLVNADEMARQHPKTFTVPDDAARQALTIGDFVKVSIYGERIWIEVTQINEGLITGKVNSQPIRANLHGFKEGSLVEFCFANIFQIQKADA